MPIVTVASTALASAANGHRIRVRAIAKPPTNSAIAASFHATSPWRTRIGRCSTVEVTDTRRSRFREVS